MNHYKTVNLLLCIDPVHCIIRVYYKKKEKKKSFICSIIRLTAIPTQSMYGTVVIRGTGPDDLCKGKGGGDSAFSYTGNF